MHLHHCRKWFPTKPATLSQLKTSTRPCPQLLSSAQSRQSQVKPSQLSLQASTKSPTCSNPHLPRTSPLSPPISTRITWTSRWRSHRRPSWPQSERSSRSSRPTSRCRTASEGPSSRWLPAGSLLEHSLEEPSLLSQMS